MILNKKGYSLKCIFRIIAICSVTVWIFYVKSGKDKIPSPSKLDKMLNLSAANIASKSSELNKLLRTKKNFVTPATKKIRYNNILPHFNAVFHINSTGIDITNVTFQVNSDNKTLVPNIFHLNWFFAEAVSFPFLSLTCMVSVFQKHQPDVVYFWYDILPMGKWWDYLLNLVHRNNYNLVFVCMDPPTDLFGQKIIHGVHKSDIIRLGIIMKYGGIYIDLDVIVLKSFKPLMNFEITMGQATKGTVNNGIMISAPGARILSIWLDEYKKSFVPDCWGCSSVQKMNLLSKEYPELIHIEERSLTHPSRTSKEISYMFDTGKFYDWSGNYCMHIWARMKANKMPSDRLSIKGLNSTLGQVFRWVWYNRTDIML